MPPEEERVKVFMATEVTDKQEKFKEDKYKDTQVWDVIDADGTIISQETECNKNEWGKRHGEIEKKREAIRQRVRNTKIGNAVIRPAKPKPTISDMGEKKVAVYARVSTKSTDQTSSIENQTVTSLF